MNNNIGKREKAFIGILALVGVGILILGIWQFKNNLEVPFFMPNGSESKTADLNDLNNNDENIWGDVTELHAKDTDSDGLSDYDELYVYNTSPYIEDTDSDGYSDKEEIDSGYDPNCPKGKDCMRSTKSQPKSEVDVMPDDAGSLFGNFDPGSLFGDSGSAIQSEGSSSSELDDFGETIMGGDLTADNLREILRQQGASEAEISQIDDETLLQVYQEIINDMENDGSLNSE